MYASVRCYRVREMAVVVRHVEQGLVPLVAQAAAFRSLALLDAGAGLLVTITVFADQVGMKEAERLTAAWFAEHLAAHVTLVDDAAGDVLVHAGL